MDIILTGSGFAETFFDCNSWVNQKKVENNDSSKCKKEIFCDCSETQKKEKERKK